MCHSGYINTEQWNSQPSQLLPRLRVLTIGGPLYLYSCCWMRRHGGNRTDNWTGLALLNCDEGCYFFAGKAPSRRLV
ncbi:unnamed protein product [Leptosia nina]|uniref:Uncharacterized protein n=1 Tax=Leptosia nina TaxID=320188 RepID=A0AAV1K4F6_9NEOP